MVLKKKQSLTLLFFLLIIASGFYLLQSSSATILAQNECPPDSDNIWVLLDTHGDGTYTQINIPFDSGYDTTDIDGPGPDVATGYINYLSGVLIAEVGEITQPEPVVFDDRTLRSMAILARTVAYENCGGVTVNGHSGIDDSNKQHYNPIRAANYGDRNRYINAVTNADDIRLNYNGDLFDVQYRSFSGIRTLDFDENGDGVYIPHKSVYDLAGRFHRNVQSAGFPQINANHYAQGRNHDELLPPFTSEQLIAHYISAVDFVGLNPDPPNDYRFNILHFGGHDDRRDDALELYTGQDYDFRYIVQNTGNNAWDLGCYNDHPWHDTALAFHWYSYPDKEYLGQIPYFEGSRQRLCGDDLEAGETYPQQVEMIRGMNMLHCMSMFQQVNIG